MNYKADYEYSEKNGFLIKRTPVVFIHWGDNGYVNMSVNQALKYNDVRIFLDFRPIQFSMEIDRWFILRDYMLLTENKRCVYLDSDVLLYKNVDNDFTNCDLAFSRYHSGHTMFVNNVKALDDFCFYIQNNINSTPMRQMNLINATRERIPEGVFANTLGDMVLLNNFIYDSNYHVEDTSNVVNNSLYDHNVNLGTVLLGVEDGFPRRVMENGEAIKMNSVHFQGGAKRLMKGAME